MRKASLFIFLFISIFLLSEFPVDAARGISVISDLSHKSGKLGAYRALIIGIKDYKDPKIPDLETAVNDAKAMAELLRERYGFQVKLLLNQRATKVAIYRALRSLASSTKPDESVLIYYAGHGDIDRTYDDGWWIPVDAKGGDPITYLDNVQVQKSMRSMKARHVLLISDSCYSGTLFGQARAMPQVIDDKYYLNLYNEKSRWGMTSGNKTPVPDRGSEGHSFFAYQLLKELKNNEKPFISTQEIYVRIAPIIGNNSEQTPLCRPVLNTGDQGGEFVFVATIQKPSLEDEKPTPIVPKIQQSVIDKDAIFWQSIQNSDNPELFKAYLGKFPNGTFAPLAKIKIKELSKDIPQKKEDVVEPKDKVQAALKVPEVKVKKEKPQKDTATLIITSNYRGVPSDGIVHLKNSKGEIIDKGQTPYKKKGLKPGLYKIKVADKEYPNLYYYYKKLYLESDKITKIDVKFVGKMTTANIVVSD